MHFFGQMMEDEMKWEGVTPRKGPRNFLTTLDKKTFDMNYLQTKLTSKGLLTSAADMVAKWKHRHLIDVSEDGLITKIN